MINSCASKPKQSSFTREELIKCGTGEMNGTDFPRLPLPNMLMLDRIVRISDKGGRYGKGEIIAELDIHPGLWFFSCHFKDDPLMPGSLGLDALCQLMGFYLAWKGHKGRGRTFGFGNVKFRGEILPSAKKVTYHVDIKRVMAGKIVMAIADGDVSVKGEKVYTAKALRVGIISHKEKRQ